MLGADVLRNLTLLVPLVAVAVAVAMGARHPGRIGRRAPAAVLATLLAWVGILAVEGAGDWWRFEAGPTTVLGMPLETSMGWALAWGALPVLTGGHPGLWWWGFAWADLVLVPRLEPLVVLEPGWLVGEVVLLVVVAVPALALGHATRRGRWLALRVGLQVVLFTGLFGWLAPTLALARDGLDWRDVVDHGPAARAGLLALAVLVGVPVMSAVVELARVGRGTPFPWDPTRRLVTTGPYAYLRNPMQVGACALLALLGFAAGSRTLLTGVAFSVLFSLAVADPHERTVLADRWPGPGGYEAYRRAVRAWWPRWRPAASGVPATLWVSQACALCRATGHAVVALGVSGLEMRAAESCPVPLTRMRWSAPGVHDRGVAALGRALEHGCLASAWVGWLIRLPGIGWVVQLVADACGLGPRDLGGAAPTVSTVAL